jgi:hypothetical protein
MCAIGRFRTDGLRELALVQLVIEAPLAEELGMIALLDDPSAVHDDDLVHVTERGKTVRDDERRAAVPQPRQVATEQTDQHERLPGLTRNNSVQPPNAGAVSTSGWRARSVRPRSGTS